MIQTLCAAVVEKRERSVAELEEQGRLCAEDGTGLGPCKSFKLFFVQRPLTLIGISLLN